jgi:hypothetical protein
MTPLYHDSQLIGRHVEDLDWQRLALDSFFQDEEKDHE